MNQNRVALFFVALISFTFGHGFSIAPSEAVIIGKFALGVLELLNSLLLSFHALINGVFELFGYVAGAISAVLSWAKTESETAVLVVTAVIAFATYLHNRAVARVAPTLEIVNKIIDTKRKYEPNLIDFRNQTKNILDIKFINEKEMNIYKHFFLNEKIEDGKVTTAEITGELLTLYDTLCTGIRKKIYNEKLALDHLGASLLFDYLILRQAIVIRQHFDDQEYKKLLPPYAIDEHKKVWSDYENWVRKKHPDWASKLSETISESYTDRRGVTYE